VDKWPRPARSFETAFQGTGNNFDLLRLTAALAVLFGHSFVLTAGVQSVETMDPLTLFLYYDDDDMCMRMAAAGHCPVLVPSAVAEHRGGGSVRPSAGYYWEKFWHMAWSRLYIEEKYHGAVAMRRMGLANALTYAVKAAAHAITLNRA